MNDIDLTRLDLNLLVTFEVLMTEGNVTRAAQRLGRTQSAVSHSLARLREQVGDPLMIKMGRGMEPSPFALQLIEDVRPILRSIQRVVAPPEPFDPATSKRILRLAIADFAPTLLPTVLARVHREAPGLAIEWTMPGPQTVTAVAEGQIDMALLASAVATPEGVVRQSAGELHSFTFARKNHPAIASWGAAAWTQWPHIQVLLGERLKSIVEVATERNQLKRTIGAWIPHFSHVPALLASTDLLATMTPLVVEGAIERFGLCALEPPVSVPPRPLSFVWSFRLANDPGSRWIRTLVIESFEELQKSAAAKVSGRNLIKVRRGRR